MGYKIEGRIHLKGDTEQITPRFTKREVVLATEEDSRYPQFVSFQFTGQRCPLLDEFDVGEVVELDFRLRGRQWTSRSGEVRYFNSLEIMEIRRVGAESGKGSSRSDEPRMDEPPSIASSFSDDEIPF